MRIVTFLLVFQFVSDHPFIALILWWFLKKAQAFFFIWYFFCILISLWTYLLCVWGVFVGKTWYALCASYIDRLWWCFPHPCISLLKFLSISHSSLPVEQVLFLLLAFVAQLFVLQVLVLLFSYLCSLARVCVKDSRREWGFHVMHTTLKCKSYLVHVPWGVPSYFL